MSSKHVGIEQARKTLGDLVREAEQGTDIILTRGNSRRPVARITTLEDTTMRETHVNVEESNRVIAEIDKQRQKDRGVETVYGSWHRPGLELTPESYVAGVLGEYADDYDVDALVAEFVAAVNDELPDGVVVRGDEVVGPVHDRPEVDLVEAVEAVDFWAIAARHDRTATEDTDTVEAVTVTVEHIRDLYDARATDRLGRNAPVLALDGDGALVVCHTPTPEVNGWKVVYEGGDLVDYMGGDWDQGAGEALAADLTEDLATGRR
jgi:prevent-host-death family protein